jgi:predicted nucleic acid-binding protein
VIAATTLGVRMFEPSCLSTAPAAPRSTSRFGPTVTTPTKYVSTDDEHWQRAFDAQRVLVRTGRHRAIGIADLLTAVLASEHRLTVVHYDSDFDTAAEVMSFEHRWVAPRGAIT